MTPKNIHKSFISPKNIHFSENSKNIEILNFEPPKNDPSLRMYENIRVAPPPPGRGTSSMCENHYAKFEYKGMITVGSYRLHKPDTPLTFRMEKKSKFNTHQKWQNIYYRMYTK